MAELPLQRRGDRGGHHLRAGAGIEGLHLDGRIIDRGQGGQRQEAESRESGQHDRHHQQRRGDRTPDEGLRDVHAAGASAAHYCPPLPAPVLGCAPSWLRRWRRWPCAGSATRTGRGGASRGGLRFFLLRDVRDHAHLRAFAQAVGAVDHHHVAGRQSGRHCDIVAVGLAEFQHAHAGLAVGADDIGVIARRAMLHGGGRRGDGVLQGVDQQADIDELVGKQRLVLIVELGAELDHAGGGVDLVVEHGDGAGRQQFDIGAVIGGRRSACRRRASGLVSCPTRLPAPKKAPTSAVTG